MTHGSKAQDPGVWLSWRGPPGNDGGRNSSHENIPNRRGTWSTRLLQSWHSCRGMAGWAFPCLSQPHSEEKPGQEAQATTLAFEQENFKFESSLDTQ